jgi:hypothetical protein
MPGRNTAIPRKRMTRIHHVSEVPELNCRHAIPPWLHDDDRDSPVCFTIQMPADNIAIYVYIMWKDDKDWPFDSTCQVNRTRILVERLTGMTII